MGRKILEGLFLRLIKKISGPPDSQFYVKQLHKVNNIMWTRKNPFWGDYVLRCWTFFGCSVSLTGFFWDKNLAPFANHVTTIPENSPPPPNPGVLAEDDKDTDGLQPENIKANFSKSPLVSRKYG